MTLRDWLDGSTYEKYKGFWRKLGQFVNYGTSLYNHEWDMAIILDACRWDLMAEVADEYEFLTDEWRYSCASSSGEWHVKTFDSKYAKEMSKTALVSANLHTDVKLSENQFALLDEVWKHSFDEEEGTIPPEAVTNCAIRAYREDKPERMIVHYMQPHTPFRANPYYKSIPVNIDYTPWDTAWDKLRKGETTRDELWPHYLENLRYVLDSVKILLNSVTYDEVIITSDHGNLLGEFGLYGHPQFVPLPSLKRVPWITTSAHDTSEYELQKRKRTAVPKAEQLKALGYTDSA